LLHQVDRSGWRNCTSRSAPQLGLDDDPVSVIGIPEHDGVLLIGRIQREMRQHVRTPGRERLP